MIIGPGVNIQSGVNMVTPQDQYFPNETLLLSYGPNVAPAGDAQSFTQDASTNNFAVTINGDAKNETFSPFWPDGYWSNYFDGTGDYLSVATNAALDWGTGDLTIEAWIYPTSVTGFNYICSQQTSGGMIFTLDGTSFLVGIYGGTTATFASSITVGRWNHVALVRSSGVTQVFLNGASLGTTSTSFSFPAGRNFLIGTSSVLDNNFDGYMSNFRAVKGTAVYTSAFTAPTAPLSAITNTSLLTCRSNRFIDNSTNNFAITVNGNTSVTVTEPFGFRLGTVTATVPNSSAVTSGYSSTYFNGSSDYLSVPNSVLLQPGSGDFTYEFWVNKPAAANGPITDFRTTATAVAGAIYIDASNFPYWYDGTASRTSTVAITNNVWNHVAVCKASGTLRIFVNGVQGYSAADAITYSPAGPLLIGGQPSTPSYTTGYISNLRFVKGVAVYTTAFTPPAAPLGLTQSAGTNISAITTGQTVFLQNGTTYGNNKNYVDSSANNFPITLTGNPSQTPISPFYGNNYSVFFDGSSNFSASGNPAWRPGTADFTLECWVYHTTSGTTTVYFIDQTNGITFRKNSSDLLQISQDAVADLLSSSTTIPINQWAHVAVSRAGTTLRLFINGTQVGSLTNSTNFAGTGTLTIGATAVPNARMSGFISNMRMVNGTALYTANFTPPTAPLTAVSGTGLLFLQGTRFTDNSNYGTTFTVTGTPRISQYIPFAAPTYSAALYGGSAFLNGSSSVRVTSTASAFDITGNFTVECWVNISSIPADGDIFGVEENATGYAAVQVQITPSRTLVLNMSTSGSSWALASTSVATLPLNSWNHIAVVRSGTSVVLYLNGVSIISGTVSGSLYSSGSFTIVGSRDSGGFITGYVSNFRFLNGTALYTSAFTPPSIPLTAVTNTSLLLNTNNTNTYDLSLSNPVTNVSGASQSTRQPFTVPTTGITYSGVSTFGSGYFDGTGDYLTLAPGAAFAFGTGDFTVELWVNFNNANGTAFYIIDARNASQLTAWALYRTTANILSWYNGSTELSSSFTATNSWNHVAYTRSGTTGRLFFNGVQVGSATDSTNYSVSPTSSFIGCRYNATEFIQGYISNLQVVKGTAIYTANFTPPAFPASAIPTTSLLTLQQDGPANNSGFIDTGPNNLLVTRSGNTTQGSFTPYWPDGYWSNYFDGTGDHITVPDNASNQLSGSQYTIEMWLYPTSTGTERRFFNKNAASTYGYTFYLTAADVVCFRTDNTNMTAGTLTAPPNRWTHVAVTNDGTNTRIYVNGVLSTSATGVTITNEAVTLRIGARQYDGSNAYTGYISNVRLLKGTALYTGTGSFTVPTSPLTVVQNTSLLTCQSNRFIDKSVNNFTLTIAGDTSVQRWQPFSPPAAYTPASYGGSMYFDGTGDYLTSVSSPAFAFGTGDFTIEFWTYPRANSRQDWIYFTGNVGLVIAYFSTGSSFAVFSNPPNSQIITGSSMPLNQWYHVALTRQSSNTRLFVNGVQQGSTYTTSQNYGVNNTLNIGRDPNGATLVTGYLSDIRVLVGTALYTTTFTPPTSPLQVITNTAFLLPGNNAAIYDRTGTNDLETLGNTQTVTSVRKLGAGCMYFDGTSDYLNIPSGPINNLTQSNFTIEFWMYPTATPATAGWLYANVVSGTTYAVSLSYRSTNRIEIYFKTTAGTTFGLTTSTGTAPLNTWSYITLTVSGSTAYFFINGVLDSTIALSSNIVGAGTQTYIGYESPAGASSFFYTGYLDNYQITRGVARYTANFTPPVDNPIYR